MNRFRFTLTGSTIGLFAALVIMNHAPLAKAQDAGKAGTPPADTGKSDREDAVKALADDAKVAPPARKAEPVAPRAAAPEPRRLDAPAPAPAPKSDLQLSKKILKDIEYYWGKKRKIKVVQNRMYPKKGRHELSIFAGVVPNDPFMVYVTPGIRWTWHLKEIFGLEVSFGYLGGVESTLKTGLEDICQETGKITCRVDLLEKQFMQFNINAVFSLIYGKVGLAKHYLSHFDLFLTAGFDGHLLQDYEGKNIKFQPGGNFGFGLKFFIRNWLGFRIDVKQYFFPKSARAKGGVHMPTEISLGVSFFVG